MSAPVAEYGDRTMPMVLRADRRSVVRRVGAVAAAIGAALFIAVAPPPLQAGDADNMSGQQPMQPGGGKVAVPFIGAAPDLPSDTAPAPAASAVPVPPPAPAHAQHSHDAQVPVITHAGNGETAKMDARKADAGRAVVGAQTMTANRPVTAQPAAASRKILYYRNPMGLADVSATPKKDAMGMDYIPVFEGQVPDDPASVTLSPGRIQRGGVRTAPAEARVVITPVRGAGTVKYDDNRVHVVSVGLDATVDEVFVRHVGAKVRQGQPLFRVWSSNQQLLQIEIARRYHGNADQDTAVQTTLTGNYRVPQPANRSDWPSPSNGVVIAKRVVAGQRVNSTDELMRIADTSRMWVITDIAERDLAYISPGQKADVVPSGASARPIEGTVLFILPSIKSETRTAQICLEVPNPDGKLIADMFAEVTIRAGADRDPVVAVPDEAIIDDGVRQRVLIDQGDGRFGVRTVTLGARGQGYAEIVSGVEEGESVVTSANFLIDSEANIEAALAAFAAAARK